MATPVAVTHGRQPEGVEEEALPYGSLVLGMSMFRLFFVGSSWHHVAMLLGMFASRSAYSVGVQVSLEYRFCSGAGYLHDT